MTKFLKHFGRDSRGVTSIEYGLIAGVMGVGVLMSINYVADELTAMVQPKDCTWEKIAPEAEEQSVACIGSKGWSARRARRPGQSRIANSTN